MEGPLVAVALAVALASNANITVFHINPARFGAIPFNMDVGDASGDLYFLMRSWVAPIECAENPESEDCKRAQHADFALRVCVCVCVRVLCRGHF